MRFRWSRMTGFLAAAGVLLIAADIAAVRGEEVGILLVLLFGAAAFYPSTKDARVAAALTAISVLHTAAVYAWSTCWVTGDVFSQSVTTASFGVWAWGAVSLLLLPVALCALLWLRRRRALPGHCQHCGYNLTGNVSGRCPECGQPVESGGVP